VELPLFRIPPAAGSSGQWIGWAFLASGLALAIGGWALYRSGRASSERQAGPAAAAARQAVWRKH
jgi:hypothetical protein